MKTVLAIAGAMLLLTYTPSNWTNEKKYNSIPASSVYTDSVLEAGRIERMINKLI